MDEVRSESTEDRTQENALKDLHSQILELLCNKLTDKSVMVMSEELNLMKRSFYFLEIHPDDELPPSVEEQNYLLSISDQGRLQRAVTMANSHVKLLLSLLEQLFNEVVSCRRELEAFILKYDQGLVDGDMAASAQQKLPQIYQYVNDFKSRLTRNLGPLNLPNQLIRNRANVTTTFSASLVKMMPVMFNRSVSHTTSSSVHLFWDIEGDQPTELNQQFELRVQRILQATDKHEPSSTFACRTHNYDAVISNLIPDSFYTFSVQRTSAQNLAYGLWVDTMILKT